MRTFTAALASCALVFLLFGPGTAQAQQNPPPLATAKPYKAIAVQPPQRFIDASFAEFRQHLGEVVKRKDRNALRSMVVGKGFFWESDDSDKIDAKKSSFENFVAAVRLDAKDGAGWDLLEAAADETTAEEVQDRKGVMCAPATPSFDENAFDELTRETKTDVEEWGYPTAAGVEVHATAKPNSSVIEKLGMNLVRVLDSDESNGADAPLKVVTPAGKLGYVDSDALAALVFDQLCYSKESGSWKIVGYAGGVLTQGARSPQRLSTHDGWTMRGPKMKQSSLPTNRSKKLDKRDKTPAAGPHGKEELTDPNKNSWCRNTTHTRINRGQHNRLTEFRAPSSEVQGKRASHYSNYAPVKEFSLSV